MRLQSTLSRAAQAVFILLTASWLIACGSGIGPQEKALLGTWSLAEEQPISDTASLTQTQITYLKDGLSLYEAVLVVDPPESLPVQLAVEARVAWTLEETVLTRALQSMAVMPMSGTGAAPSDIELAMAKDYQDAFLTSPPAQFIIQTLDETQLVLLDPIDGSLLTFARN